MTSLPYTTTAEVKISGKDTVANVRDRLTLREGCESLIATVAGQSFLVYRRKGDGQFYAIRQAFRNKRGAAMDAWLCEITMNDGVVAR